MAKAEKIRLNLEFTPRVAENLERLVDLSESSSRTEVIRKALKLFDLVLSRQAEGSKVLFQDPDGSKETVHIL
ncbi:MAG: hypothetical protein V3T72_13975 [Thermoanaerobaculia bacterium]